MGDYFLREKPELKIIVNKNDFEIIDYYETKNSGKHVCTTFLYATIVPESTNWLVTITSYLFSSFMISDGSLYKNRPKLHIDLVDRTIKINLFDVDLKYAMKIVAVLNAN